MKVKMFINFVLLVIVMIGVLLFAPESKQIIGGWVAFSMLFSFWIPEIVGRKVNGGDKH